MRKQHLLLVLALASCSGAFAQPTDDVHEVLRARRFEMVDDNGAVRAQINVEPGGGVVLRLRDQQGTIRVKLGADQEGSGLLLNNDATEPGLHAIANASGTSIKLRNKDGKEVVIVP